MECAAWYRYFAATEARNSSRTYQVLADGVAADRELCRRLDAVPVRQRQPNLLFASVRYLAGPTDGWDRFRSFVESNWADIAQLLATRSTQTNEAARCGAIVPLLAALPQPIALIEVGASAGLCLLPDRYSYAFTGPSFTHRVGESALEIEVECSGPVPLPSRLPEISWRRGIDLDPVDVRDTDDMAWLQACVWPEHHGRRARLDRAASIAASDPPTIVAGDLVDTIGPILDEAPADATIVVVHSAVLPYLGNDARQQFAATMRARDDVTWISNESPGVVPGLDTPSSAPESAHFVLGLNGTPMAFTDPHGGWLAWLPTS